MNRFLFTAIFLWVANFSAMAQAYKVSGHVFLHGQPLSFASIKNAHKRKCLVKSGKETTYPRKKVSTTEMEKQ